MHLAFEEHVKAANLAFMTPMFRPGFDSFWINKGDRIRGKWLLLPAPLGWEATRSMLEARRRNGWSVEYATAYELAAFAADPGGWNGVDTVMAPGSEYSGGRPCLRRRIGSQDNQRELYIESRLTWRINVLAVMLP